MLSPSFLGLVALGHVRLAPVLGDGWPRRAALVAQPLRSGSRFPLTLTWPGCCSGAASCGCLSHPHPHFLSSARKPV